jgi:hypothetical protein
MSKWVPQAGGDLEDRHEHARRALLLGLNQPRQWLSIPRVNVNQHCAACGTAHPVAVVLFLPCRPVVVG